MAPASINSLILPHSAESRNWCATANCKPRALGQFHEVPALGNGERQRLLHQQVLARLQHRATHFVVQVRRQDNAHHLDIGAAATGRR